MTDNDLIRRRDAIAILSAASRTAQKTIDAIAALEAAHHVNRTPKNEHDRADVLTAPVTLAEATKVPRIVTFHTAGRFGVCIGGRWDGWVMMQHPDGYWVSHHKPDPVDPSIPTLRAIGEGEA